MVLIMKSSKLFLISFLYLASISNAQDYSVKTYANDSLGISFQYTENGDDDPYGYYYDEIPTVNLKEWKTYYSVNTGIELKYPDSLIVQEEKETENGKVKYVIELGRYDKKSQNIFLGIIDIYTDDKNFYQIAESKDFKFTPNKDSAFIEDQCGDISFATKLEGYNCSGFRIQHCAMFSAPEMGAYAIPNDDRVSLLVFNFEEGKIIVAYYDDYSYTQNNETNLTENEFYILASTIKYIKK
jgi:hypothetical protein